MKTTASVSSPPRQGDVAPTFSLPAKPGEMIDFSEHVGNAPVVLLFFPLAFSSVCTEGMCHMRDHWASYKSLGAVVFGISVDSPFVTSRFREELNVPFPILSDFNREVSAAFGALHDDLMGLRGVSKRAAFVVDRTGRIAYAWVSDDPGQQVPFDDLAAAVKAV